MKFKQGSAVQVTDHWGVKKELHVWECVGDVVFVTSKKIFNSLQLGDFTVPPIGINEDRITPLAET